MRISLLFLSFLVPVFLTGQIFLPLTDNGLYNDQNNALSSSWADMDGDGFQDVFTSFGALFVSDNGTNFTPVEEGELYDSGTGISATWGDYDQDGFPDLYIAQPQGINPVQGSKLFHNNGDGTFSLVMDEPFLSDTNDFQGASFIDIENDGDLDIYVAAGGNTGYRNNSLYINNGDGTFTELVAEMQNENLNLGCTWADWDNDGDQDALYTWEGYLSPYENQGNDNNWLNIQCTGIVSNTTAIGTKVWLYAYIDGVPVMQLREISGQTGVLGQSDMRAHFGLGDATVADSVRIEWPSGIVQIMENPPINQHMMVLEDTSLISSVKIIQSPVTAINVFPNPTTDFVQLQFETSRSIEFRMQLFDVQGRQLQSFPAKYLPEGIHTEILDLSGLAPGSYFIRLTTDSGLSFTKKVVVE